MLKVCTKCGVEKRQELFSRRGDSPDGLKHQCKACDASYASNHASAHKVRIAAYMAAYYAAHKYEIAAKQAARKEEKAAKDVVYKAAHRKEIAARKKARKAADPGFKILENLRTRLYDAMRGETKSAGTMELVGCSIQYLRDWLAWQFQPGMGWCNYGQWHIDHIRPCASFDLTDPDQQRECFHFQNLQPLWAADNIRKGAKCPTTFPN